MSGGRLEWEPTGYQYIDKGSGLTLRTGLAQIQKKLKWWWDVVDEVGDRFASGFAGSPSEAKGKAHKVLEAVKNVKAAKAPLPVQCEISSAPGFATSSPGVKCE